jgi:tripartite motif-containing protein 71
MVRKMKRRGALGLRLTVGLALLGCSRVGSAAGTWLVIGDKGTAIGQVTDPGAVAVDTAGSLYIADAPDGHDRIQRRDAQGHWSVIATNGTGLGQARYPTALAVDSASHVYVADGDDPNYRIQKRDTQGNWSMIANFSGALAADTAGNLYVAADGIWKRDAQGNWSVLDADHSGRALTVDAVGNLYVANVQGLKLGLIQKRDVRGDWSVLAGVGGEDDKEILLPHSLAADETGNLFVAEGGLYWDSLGPDYVGAQVERRDAQGNWCVIAGEGSAPGEVLAPSGLAVDGAGSLYVADTGNSRVLKYTPQP